MKIKNKNKKEPNASYPLITCLFGCSLVPAKVY